MAAKIAFVFVCIFVIFQTLDAAAVQQSQTDGDSNILTKPIEDALFTVKANINNLVEKIKANPLYERASESVNTGYETAKTSINDTYEKIQACKNIIEGYGTAQNNH